MEISDKMLALRAWLVQNGIKFRAEDEEPDYRHHEQTIIPRTDGPGAFISVIYGYIETSPEVDPSKKCWYTWGAPYEMECWPCIGSNDQPRAMSFEEITALCEKYGVKERTS